MECQSMTAPKSVEEFADTTWQVSEDPLSGLWRVTCTQEAGESVNYGPYDSAAEAVASVERVVAAILPFALCFGGFTLRFPK